MGPATPSYRLLSSEEIQVFFFCCYDLFKDGRRSYLAMPKTELLCMVVFCPSGIGPFFA